MSKLVTHAELTKVLSYDAKTGEFTRVIRAGNYPAGSVAGGVNSRGYVLINLKGRSYRAHRLAWFYMTGEWPSDDIDHIDGVKTNNAFSNLREATRSQNNANLPACKNNRTGFKGVDYHKATGKWRAQISIMNRPKHIGIFDTPEKAYEAYVRTATLVHGDFARFDPPRAQEGK